jgi:hypothetical protein
MHLGWLVDILHRHVTCPAPHGEAGLDRRLPSDSHHQHRREYATPVVLRGSGLRSSWWWHNLQLEFRLCVDSKWDKVLELRNGSACVSVFHGTTVACYTVGEPVSCVDV